MDNKEASGLDCGILVEDCVGYRNTMVVLVLGQNAAKLDTSMSCTYNYYVHFNYFSLFISQLMLGST